MKRIVVALLLLVMGASVSAQKKQINLGLIPTPQRVIDDHRERNQIFACNLQKAKVIERKVDTLPVECNLEQAYQLVFHKSRIYLRYVGEEGRQNAYLTLAQLKQLHTAITCVTITDWPAYRYRGWMDDISRGPVPHARYRQKQWETLHALKYNFCNYYTEHTLYQPEFPDLAPAYAAECKPHPDEVINLQLFAHAEKTLRIPFYQSMMDSKVNFNPGVEETYRFLEKRIAAAYNRIPSSPFFIINCDETEQLGTGRAKNLVDSLGADQVYVDFINRCYNMIGTYHWGQWEGTDENYEKVPDAPRIAMWGDIVAKNPEMMKQLPKDMIYIMWAYEPIDSFKSLIKPFKVQGNPFWVAASTGHSATMTSTPQRYIKNIANLFRDGYRDGAEGAMITCWDDNGEALFDNSWHAHFWAAEMAWNPLKTDDPEELRQREEQFNRNYARLFYGDSTLANVESLYKVGAMMYNPVTSDLYTSSALWHPLLNITPSDLERDVDKLLTAVSQAEEGLDSAKNPHAHYTILHYIASSGKLTLQQAITKQLNCPSKDNAELCRDFAQTFFWDLYNLKHEFLQLWDQENGDYERYIVMNRYDNLARDVFELDRHVFVSVEPYHEMALQSVPMVTLRTLYNDRPIYYTLDGSEPNEGSTIYTAPFPLKHSATIKAISYNQYGEGVVTEQYLLSHKAMGTKITLNTKYSDYKAIYSGGGPDALIDGQLGSNTTYADGHWQGYWGDSIDAVIDLGTPKDLHSIKMRFMQNTFDWILAPTCIKVYGSTDGTSWILLANKQFQMNPRETGMRLKDYSIDMELASKSTPKIILSNPYYRYLRVVVPNPGPLPDWHPAPGQPSYLFTDEIIIE